MQNISLHNCESFIHTGFKKSRMSQTWWRRSVIPATGEAEAGGSQVQALFGLQSEFKDSLSNLVRPGLKIKVKEGWDYSSVLERSPNICEALESPRTVKSRVWCLWSQAKPILLWDLVACLNLLWRC